MSDLSIREKHTDMYSYHKYIKMNCRNVCAYAYNFVTTNPNWIILFYNCVRVRARFVSKEIEKSTSGRSRGGPLDFHKNTTCHLQIHPRVSRKSSQYNILPEKKVFCTQIQDINPGATIQIQDMTTRVPQSKSRT